MEFMVKTSGLKNSAEGLSKEASTIADLYTEIRSVRQSLKQIQGIGMSEICFSLSKDAMKLNKKRKNILNLSSSLQDIAAQYEATEQKLLSADCLKNQGNAETAAQSGAVFAADKEVTDQEKDTLIAEYEAQHEKQAADFNEYLNSCDPNPLTEEDIRNIKYLTYTAEEPFRSMYLNSLSKYKLKTMSLSGGAYYRAWSHEVNYTYPDSFSDDPRGAYTTFFHESGHAIDDLSDKSKWLGSDTEKITYYSEELGKKIKLREAIEYDVYRNPNNSHSITSIANEIISSGKTGKNGNVENVIQAFQSGNTDSLSKDDLLLYNSVKHKFQQTTGNDASFEAVTDVYGGVSNNELRNNGYGHDDSYWTDESKAGKELWAEYFSYNMAGDQENLNNLYEYFPEASKMLDQYAASFE